MRFVTFQHAGVTCPGVLSRDGERVLSLDEAGVGPYATLLDMIAAAGPDQLARALAASETSGGVPLAAVRLLAPIPRPPHDILCVGVNYRAHLEESESAMGEIPHQSSVYFSKRANPVTGPDEVLDGHLELDSNLDYEVELAVVIGKGGRDIPPDRAAEHIFGYSVFNDLSARALQKRHNQWYRGKSLDGFAVMGPALVTADEIPFPPLLTLESRVNGEVRQHSNTRLYLSDIPHLIAELSQGMTLEPGDIIATGTPSGVGMGFTPPRWLKRGDVVECEIQGVGLLKTTVR
ncbi:MAG: fumarylacetoacetate hydrolase family protein [Oscillospiraceae bacterium]|jgi:2-keto-4-pentenoate hydratase/2-oxohepta-3-ene-1,7-dioic acid hydratase in catechol pathway